jgi:hypothetical protein
LPHGRIVQGKERGENEKGKVRKEGRHCRLEEKREFAVFWSVPAIGGDNGVDVNEVL